MATLSTHVLDTAAGRPAEGLRITLESADGNVLAEALTDADGRVGTLAADLVAEDHVLRFDTGGWFAARGGLTHQSSRARKSFCRSAAQRVSVLSRCVVPFQVSAWLAQGL